jgi:hypothetical protein
MASSDDTELINVGGSGRGLQWLILSKRSKEKKNERNFGQVFPKTTHSATALGKRTVCCCTTVRRTNTKACPCLWTSELDRTASWLLQYSSKLTTITERILLDPLDRHIQRDTVDRGADKSLARPTSRCTLFDCENLSFDASLAIYIYIYVYKQY